MYLGEHQTALEHQRKAERLSPRDPNIMQVRVGAAFAHFFERNNDEAVRLGQRITDEFPAFGGGWRILAVSSALGGDPVLAQRALQKAVALDPTSKVSALATHMPLRRAEDRERWKEGLIKAGFPG
jgi:predicted Zn-dependent protease